MGLKKPDAAGGARADLESFDHHNSSLTGYNFLSLSLALGIVKRQSIDLLYDPFQPLLYLTDG
jgi:hypothetical protein